MSEYPKVTVIPVDGHYLPKVFVGEDEFPFEAWDVKAEFYDHNINKVTLTFLASTVEFKTID